MARAPFLHRAGSFEELWGQVDFETFPIPERFNMGGAAGPMFIDEPARGGISGPTAYNLSGLDRLKALMSGLLPAPPLTHLIGHKGTQVAPGTSA